jgi:hypothetical protein
LTGSVQSLGRVAAAPLNCSRDLTEKCFNDEGSNCDFRIKEGTHQSNVD